MLETQKIRFAIVRVLGRHASKTRGVVQAEREYDGPPATYPEFERQYALN